MVRKSRGSSLFDDGWGYEEYVMQWIRTSNPWTPAKIRAGGSGTSLSLVVSSALSHPPAASIPAHRQSRIMTTRSAVEAACSHPI
ncbi:hypothetical protein OAH23_03740 [Verrucomicrobia bacterium]|nr:hypothetical protein [Verrucomicrobiota bacterium]